MLVVYLFPTTVTRVRLWLCEVVWLNVTVVVSEKSVVQFNYTKHRRFSRGTPASCLFIYLLTYLFIHLFIYLLTTFHEGIYLYIYLFIYILIYLFIN